MKQTEVSPDQTGREAEHESTRTLAGPGSQAAASGADPAGTGNPAAALRTVSAGIRSGISPLQLMDSIDAGSRQLGNRAFMHWVGQLHGEGQAGATREIAAQGLQGPGRPLTHLDTLQRAFGHHDIRGMREHTGAVAGSALDALDAEGYTRGGRMALGGAPDLYTQAHEAAHGVQQAALGERMALAGGIGVAGDRYERQADEVARAVLRGESAQALLDRGVAGPVQVHADPVGTTAPVQMRRKKHSRAAAPRPGNAPGQDLPAAEQEAVELADVAAQPEAQAPAGGGVDSQELAEALDQVQQAAGEAADLAGQPDVQAPAAGSMDISPFEDHQDPDQFVANPVYQPFGGGERELEEGLADLDRLAREMLDLAGEPAQQQAAAGNAANRQPGDGERDYLATVARYLFPGAQAAGADDARGTGERYFTYFFPAITYLYSCLRDRAGQVQTDEHGACSLRGILNMLATLMFGVMMVAPGLPLDVMNNFLGGVAKVIVMLSAILGLPAEWLLKRYQEKYPPSEEDRARVSSSEPPQGLPGCLDWNVVLPQLVAVSAMSVFLQACNSQCSLSPSRWIHPWTGGRIASMVIQTLLVDIAYLLRAAESSRRVLQNSLRWSATRSAIFVSMLYSIVNVVSSYILSYLTNTRLAVYLVYQNMLDDNRDLWRDEATAAFLGYAALGMLIHVLAGTLILHFVLRRVNENNLVPWRRQFSAVRNRHVRRIAVALASLRNAVVKVVLVSLTTSQVSANVLGPLASRYGQGGACFWPLAAAGVCGQLPDDFDFLSLL